MGSRRCSFAGILSNDIKNVARPHASRQCICVSHSKPFLMSVSVNPFSLKGIVFRHGNPLDACGKCEDLRSNSFPLWNGIPKCPMKKAILLKLETCYRAGHSRREGVEKVPMRSDHISLTLLQCWFTHHNFFENSTTSLWDMATLTCLFWEPWIKIFGF